jgi:hypothetical protein
MDPPAQQTQNRWQTKRFTLRPEWKDNRISLVASIKPSPNAAASSPPPNRPGPMAPSDSPLTQQTRPAVFEPKVVTLYRKLFRELDDDEKPKGFWRELFLLKPDIPRLRQLLEDTDPNYLLQVQHQPQQVVVHATHCIKEGVSPGDENALDVNQLLLVSKSILLPS